MLTASLSLARSTRRITKSKPLTLVSQIVRDAMPGSPHRLSTFPQSSPAILAVFHFMRGTSLDFYLQQEVKFFLDYSSSRLFPLYLFITLLGICWSNTLSERTFLRIPCDFPPSPQELKLKVCVCVSVFPTVLTPVFRTVATQLVLHAYLLIKMKVVQCSTHPFGI